MGGRKNNAMLLKGAVKEMNRLESNCSANSSIQALHHVSNPSLKPLKTTKSTETNKAIMRYPKPLTLSPMREGDLLAPEGRVACETQEFHWRPRAWLFEEEAAAILMAD